MNRYELKSVIYEGTIRGVVDAQPGQLVRIAVTQEENGFATWDMICSDDEPGERVCPWHFTGHFDDRNAAIERAVTMVFVERPREGVK